MLSESFSICKQEDHATFSNENKNIYFYHQRE
jgi:hypothetical protein